MKLTFWDLLSIVFLTATIVVIAVVMVIFANPKSPLNPFPFPTMPPTMAVPTNIPTVYYLPATWTPTPTATETPVPTPTKTMTPTVEIIEISPTP